MHNSINCIHILVTIHDIIIEVYTLYSDFKVVYYLLNDGSYTMYLRNCNKNTFVVVTVFSHAHVPQYLHLLYETAPWRRSAQVMSSQSESRVDQQIGGLEVEQRHLLDYHEFFFPK